MRVARPRSGGLGGVGETEGVCNYARQVPRPLPKPNPPPTARHV